jgi:predicted porin
MAKLSLALSGLALGLSSCTLRTDAAAHNVPALDFYGSLRTQVETVSPDRSDRLDRYTSLRDAYSRLGVKADYPLGNGLVLTGQLEMPVDSANFRIRDPYDQGDAARPHGQRIRIAQLGLRGGFGSLAYGQQWMPYYNAIATPVDRFSSYYTGFATYTVFRVAETLAWSSPEFKGLSLAAAYAGSGGNKRSTSRIDDRRRQVAATYTFGNTRLAAAIDDRGNAGDRRDRLFGLSASHQADTLYLAIKYERFDTENRRRGTFSTDGNQSVNVFASYGFGKNTVKLMLAKVENYGEHIVHLGIDHRLSDDLKVFAEYYREAETAALTRRRGGLGDFDAGVKGGHAIAVGLRRDF